MCLGQAVKLLGNERKNIQLLNLFTAAQKAIYKSHLPIVCTLLIHSYPMGMQY